MDIRHSTWRLWVIVLLVAIGSVVAYGVVEIHESAVEIEQVGESNNRFLANFSDFMRCLIVTDPTVYEELGREEYFDRCDKLLFRGTGLRAPTDNGVE